MEGYNGYARPIDKLVLAKGFRLLNINNHKRSPFKKIGAGPAKTDEIDALRMFELFTLSAHLPTAKGVLQEISKKSAANETLKSLTRRRRFLVNEKIRVVNRMQSDLQAISPDLISLSGSVDNRWFLHFISFREDIEKLASLRRSTLLTIKGVGRRYAEKIGEWQKKVFFAPDAEWVGSMIISDARHIIALQAEIQALEKAMEKLSMESEMATRLLNHSRI